MSDIINPPMTPGQAWDEWRVQAEREGGPLFSLLRPGDTVSAPHTFQPSSMISGRCEFCNKPGSDHADGIEKRIAAVLTTHQMGRTADCICGWAELGRSQPEHVAAVLVAELGLTQETQSHRQPPPYRHLPDRFAARFVTPWEEGR